MKTNRFHSVLSSAILSSAIAMGLLASGGSAQAQTISRLRASIPFDFQAGSQQMPAGSYDISMLSQYLLLLQSHGAGKQVSGILLVTPLQKGKIQMNGRLVFNRYGDRYFLREVWEADSNQGITFGPSNEEKEIVRAQNHQAASQTQLAVNGGPKQ